LAKLTLQTAKQAVEHLLVAAYTDHGEILHREAAERLLLVPGTGLPAETVQPDEIRLQQTISSYGEQAKQEAEQQNQQYYDEETEKLERWADDQRTALDLRIKQLDTEIRDYKRYVRQLATLKEKTEARREITRLERERDSVMLNYHEEKKRIEQKEDELLDQIEQALQIEPIMETLFTVRWELHP
jgi:predicted RNase H-like nuclease (RuvC/YqgF family)